MSIRSSTFRSLWFLVFFILFLFACAPEKDPRIPDEGSLEVVKIPIHRYGKALFSIPLDTFEAGLREIQDEYRFFLDGDLNDTLNVLRLKQFVSDPLLREIAAECQHRYPSLANLEDSLSLMFAHYRHHYPEAMRPDVFTYISGLHYENPVQYFGEVMIIGLDMYLGPEAPWYGQIGMPQFFAARCTPSHILPHCALEIARSHNAEPEKEDFLSKMFYDGKRTFFAGMLLPGVAENLLLNYSPAQYQWCLENEKKLWAFLVSNEYLYSTDQALINRFRQDGPFTHAFGSESPPRLATFAGWRMLSSYMQNNPEVSLQDLMQETDAHRVFRESGYKPR
jgi:hypothetical protein